MSCAFKLAKTYHLIGISVAGWILVFGGASNTSFNMFKCTEEGEAVEDMSEERGEIPGLMCGGVTQTFKERIYAISWVEREVQLRDKRFKFDGMERH